MPLSKLGDKPPTLLIFVDYTRLGRPADGAQFRTRLYGSERDGLVAGKVVLVEGDSVPDRVATFVEFVDEHTGLFTFGSSEGHRPVGGTGTLPLDLTAAQIVAAPTLASLDGLLIDGLTDDEYDAFAEALDSWANTPGSGDAGHGWQSITA